MKKSLIILALLLTTTGVSASQNIEKEGYYDSSIDKVESIDNISNIEEDLKRDLSEVQKDIDEDFEEDLKKDVIKNSKLMKL